MVQIEDISQAGENIKTSKGISYRLKSQREYYEQRRLGDRFVMLLVNLFFTYVYFLFTFVYLFRYKDHLETEFSRGFGSLVNSDTFWSFQRDIVLLIAGYFLMVFVLKKLLFNKSDSE